MKHWKKILKGVSNISPDKEKKNILFLLSFSNLSFFFLLSLHTFILLSFSLQIFWNNECKKGTQAFRRRSHFYWWPSCQRMSERASEQGSTEVCSWPHCAHKAVQSEGGQQRPKAWSNQNERWWARVVCSLLASLEDDTSPSLPCGESSKAKVHKLVSPKKKSFHYR